MFTVLPDFLFYGRRGECRHCVSPTKTSWPASVTAWGEFSAVSQVTKSYTSSFFLFKSTVLSSQMDTAEIKLIKERGAVGF
jgi:hypothetical protein